jgi:poly-gamma-glutamate synthesis protein (capsule biosynthesis protein)
VDSIAQVVGAHRPPRSLTVLSIHWGTNWGYDIPAEHRRFAHALIERAGIDLIFGHSSHHPRAIERYRSKLILYGCGDFLNDYEGITGKEQFRSDLVLMYFPMLDARTGELNRLELLPLHIRNFRLTRPAQPDRMWLARVLDRECRVFGGHVTLFDDVLVYE